MGAGCTAGIGVVMNMDTKLCRKELSGIGLRMFACAVILIAVQLIAQGFLVLLDMKLTRNPGWVQNMNIVLAVTAIPLYTIGFPCAFLIMSDAADNRKIVKRKMKPSHFFVAFPMCYALMMAGNIIGLIVTSAIGILKGEPVNNSIQDLIGNTNIWTSAIFTVLLAPICEEILYRKLLCDRLIKYGQGTSILLSGLLFGLFHGNFNQFFYAFFIGSFFAFIYVKTGNVKYTIGLHMMVNFVGGVLSVLLLQDVDPENLTPAALLVVSFYSLFIYGIVISGLVLFLLNRSKLKTDADGIIPGRSQTNRIALINVGMILYYIFCLALMIFQAVVG